MDTARWKQIEEIFDKAVTLGAAEREPYLAEVWAQDPSLKEEIESLISSHEEESPFLRLPAFERGLKVLADEPANVFEGDRFGTYKILSKLGSGGMGSVYLAIDSRLGRKVAIKFLSLNLVEDLNRVRRFRQEARAASKISHPNVAAIYEINSLEEKHFIAMEFVDGVTLRERLIQLHLPLKDAIDIAIQVGLALESAHALGIVHRDVKPENIMIRRDGYVKVLDFGLAKLTETYQHHPGHTTTFEPSTVTQAIPTEPGMLMGTATYMSPEQARGLEVDGRTDIWSWGVVLYEAIVGEPPFQGATTSDVLADILRGEPEALLATTQTLPEPLKRILRKALAKEIENRYSKIGDALNELRALQKSVEAHADPLDAKVAKNRSGLSTQAVDQFNTGKTEAADITDSHVVADNFRTIVSGPHQIGSTREPILNAFRRRLAPVVALSMGVMILVIVVVTVQQLRHRVVSRPPLEFTKLSSEENVIEAVISPDGKYIASVIDEAGARSLWLRQTSTSANLQIVTPNKLEFGGLSFSTDGDHVYYLEYSDGRGTLYSVSALGGGSRKLVENVDTPVTFSPNGHQMAFVRHGINSETDLIVANSDGTNEETLIALTGSQKFVLDSEYSTGPVWSPDGNVIASPAIDQNESAREDVVGVQIADRTVRRINRQKGVLARIRKLIWTDSKGLVMCGKDQYTSPHQLWALSYTTGEAENITNDADEYSGLSSTRDTHTLLTTRTTTLTSLWIINHESGARQIPSTNHDGNFGISWAGDGRLVYARNVGSSCDLWVMNSDGSDRKQLTFDGQHNIAPTVSPDGRYIVFVSQREGKPHLWRVAADGTGLKQLTNGTYEVMPTVSNDSKWVIYSRRNPSGLWKISIDGAESQALVKEPAYFPTVSPDGEHLAYLTPNEKPEAPWRASIIPIEGGSPVKTFAIHSSFIPSVPGLQWTADGTKLTYVISVKGVSNIWTQTISGRPPEQLTNFTEGEIYYFSWSTDRQLACIRGASSKDVFLIRGFR